QLDLVLAVDLGEQHAHLLGPGGRDVLADVVGADGQLAVAPVDEYGELHRARAAQVADRVEGGPDRTAGEQHVVDQDHATPVDSAGGHVGRADRAGRAQP